MEHGPATDPVFASDRDRRKADPAPSDEAVRVRLMSLFSPTFPIGGFAWSHGLEAALAEERLAGAAAITEWIGFLLVEGSGWNDLVLLAQTHRATLTGDRQALETIGELAIALAGSAERRAETCALGAAFLEACETWDAGGTSEAAEDVADPGDETSAQTPPLAGGADPAFPVAAGHATARMGLPLGPVATAYAHGFANQLLSAANRLAPLGRAGQVRVLADLETVIEDAARRAASARMDDLGSAAFASDVVALRHETCTTRLFRS